MKLYIAGPMRGIDGYNFKSFNVAAKILREHGHVVVNPAEDAEGKPLDPEKEYSLEEIQEFLRYDIREICSVEAVVVLDGWMYSEGANIEVSIAKIIGIPVLKFAKQSELWGDLISEEDINPASLAADTIRRIMRKGLGKHSADSWRDEFLENHLVKGARHLLSAELIDRGLSEKDEDNHIENGLCRAAMAHAVHQKRKS